MCRIILFVIFSCIVSVLCTPVLFAQDQEQHEEAVEGEPESPPPPVQPANVLVQQLLDPFVAGKLMLDNRQKSEIDRTIRQQAESISRRAAEGVTEEHYQEIYKWYEDKLRDLLTPAQRAMLETNLEDQNIRPEDRRIRMIFVHLPWGNVLQHIADQAGMQLVLDAPPPAGTHNYSSLETYTLAQVLDHINGVLITRGYNFTRSGDQKKLHLINLNAPVQLWSFPTERPDNLGARASSEFVAVTHNFGRRPADTVAATVRGRINDPFTHTWLAGQNIIVIDRVANQRPLPDVIRSIREPDPIPAPRVPEGPPRPQPPPVWRTYNIDNEKIDPDFIIQSFRQWGSIAGVFRHPELRAIHIYARTGDHNTFEGILRRLESDPALAPSAEATTDTVAPQGNRTIRLHPISP